MRKGLRIRGHRGHPVVRRALIRYARWLRQNYKFPIRVPVYLSPHPTIRKQDGEEVSATFFGPYDKTEEPYIRISTGDHALMRSERCRADVLASYIVSLSHEVIHYQQWLRGPTTERGVNRGAVRMLRRYEKTTRWP
ncbi:MAG: hypothetical protein V2A76_10780 [Planctomycetota bacterium]